MEQQPGHGSSPYMPPPPPNPDDRLPDPPSGGVHPVDGVEHVERVERVEHVEQVREVDVDHPLASRDPHLAAPAPGDNWWDDPAGPAVPVERHAEMRVLPDGSVVYEEVVEEPVPTERPARSAMLIAGIIGSLALLLLALAIGSALAVRANGGLSPQKRKAIDACHQYVQVRIVAKTPSTMTTEYAEGTGYGPWQIQGTVDGRNGDTQQPVKARYDCIVDANGDRTTWRLQKLVLI